MKDVFNREPRIADRKSQIASPRACWVGLFLALTLALSCSASGSHTTFFMGRLLYADDDGRDCSGVGSDLMQLVSKASTLDVQTERRIRLTDPALFDTPFVFMNGHYDFVLSEAELSDLRTYLDHGGFVFASGCCSQPGFPKAWRREFSRVFPHEKVRPIPLDSLIYRSLYKLGHLRCLNEPRDVRLDGLYHHGRLVAVMCQDGLCCAFSANNTCNQGKGVSPEDGKKLALNIAIYALTH